MFDNKLRISRIHPVQGHPLGLSLELNDGLHYSPERVLQVLKNYFQVEILLVLLTDSSALLHHILGKVSLKVYLNSAQSG